MTEKQRKKKVLVCPLDWGLGHATRCIPIINKLLQRNCEVMIASSGDALSLLRQEYPSLKTFSLTPYNPKYSRVSFIPTIIGQLMKFRRTMKREHHEVDKIVKDHGIDLIISDNRYGCYCGRVRSIVITHQLTLQLPRLSEVVNHYHRQALRRFNEIWVPDLPGDESLAGALSSSADLKVVHVGMLSRISPASNISSGNRYDIVALVSGPEPQRSIFEKKMRAALKQGTRTLLIKGKPSTTTEKLTASTTEINHITTDQMNEVIAAADLIISRPGYSTVMDLACAGHKHVIFVATPGQTEQEYLGATLMKKGVALHVPQRAFNLAEALKTSRDYTGFPEYAGNDLLEKAIDRVLALK